MSKSDYDNFIDPAGFSIDDIISEYKADEAKRARSQVHDEFEEQSHSIVMQPQDEDVSAAQIGGAEYAYASEPEYIPEPKPVYTPKPAYTAPEPSAYHYEPEIEPGEEYAEEVFESEYSDIDERDYAAPDYPEYYDPEEEFEESIPENKRAEREGSSIMQPIIALLAAVMVRRQQKQDAETEGEAREEVPEAPPARAAKLYASQAKPFKFRATIATVLTLILMYISYGFPLPGVFDSAKVTTLMCLLIELVVVICGLDIFTNGITTLLRGKPGAETLISISCTLSAIDAAVIAISGSSSAGLPFCVVSALSMTFAIWGSHFLCNGMRASFRTAAAASSPFVMTAEREVSEDGGVIIKSRRALTGFVRRSEDADGSETAYRTAAPILIIAVLVLGIVAGVMSGSFFHCLSVLAAVCASFSALLNFSLPFSIVARRLAGSGAAVAGWSGVSDIGKSRHTVVTDTDIFPIGTVEIGTIRILEGTFTDKVISYTGSMMISTGCSMTAAFTELMTRNGCVIHPIEDFTCHEGGGVIGMIRGEQVYVGTSGFMNLMGIRLPQSQISKDAVFTAISGELVGVFQTKYIATASVQDALVSMLQSRGCSPLFAIRDFNITPLLIKQKFRMPTESFDFPPVSERFRISAVAAEDDSPPCAAVSREGLAPMVEASLGSKSIYRATRLSTAISLLTTIAGLILMFFLCCSGSFDSAGVSNVMTSMLLCLVPILVISFGLRR